MSRLHVVEVATGYNQNRGLGGAALYASVIAPLIYGLYRAPDSGRVKAVAQVVAVKLLGRGAPGARPAEDGSAEVVETPELAETDEAILQEWVAQAECDSSGDILCVASLPCARALVAAYVLHASRRPGARMRLDSMTAWLHKQPDTTAIVTIDSDSGNTSRIPF